MFHKIEYDLNPWFLQQIWQKKTPGMDIPNIHAGNVLEEIVLKEMYWGTKKQFERIWQDLGELSWLLENSFAHSQCCRRVGSSDIQIRDTICQSISAC